MRLETLPHHSEAKHVAELGVSEREGRCETKGMSSLCPRPRPLRCPSRTPGLTGCRARGCRRETRAPSGRPDARPRRRAASETDAPPDEEERGETKAGTDAPRAGESRGGSPSPSSSGGSSSEAQQRREALKYDQPTFRTAGEEKAKKRLQHGRR